MTAYLRYELKHLVDKLNWWCDHYHPDMYATPVPSLRLIAMQGQDVLDFPAPPPRLKPTREEAVALYSEVMALHHCQTLGEMAEHFSHAVLERWGQ